jgi:superfamily II DNA/RNA helicase
MGTRFFTNRGDNTLIKEFDNVLSHNPHIKNFDAIVGFLRASGYFALRPFLDNINKVRILIGINVDKYIADAANRGEAFFGEEEKVKNEYLLQYQHDIENSQYTKEVEQGMHKMVEDIINGKLEVRAHPSKSIHAKIYILYPDGLNEHSIGAAAISGSSNLTGNGLGLTTERQYEFNVMVQETNLVMDAESEFETLWKEAANCPIDAISLQHTMNKTYLKEDVTPYEIYIKMLMEYFEERVKATDVQDPMWVPSGYTRYEYQIDAVNEGYQKLLRYDGFFLADVVGLGKTIVATMIARKFLIENGIENTKILVVYPPAVEHNWKTTFSDFGIDKYTRFVSKGSLNKVLDDDNFDYWNAEEYDLILVDEAHKFRNHATGAFQQLQEICKMPRIETGNIPGYKKKVMLISATPMNNSPLDIYHQILLFQDPRRCTIDGVTNLTNFFSPLAVEFQKLRANPDYDLNSFKRLAERVRDRIIKPITVRRTRTDIEKIERYKIEVGHFPKVAKPQQKSYQLNAHLADLFEITMKRLAEDLKYARYQAIAWLKEEKSNGLYDNAELVSRSLSYIRKNGLVKRLESSFYAFKISLNRFAQANQNMIDMFSNGRVFITPDLDINSLLEKGFSYDEIEEKMNERAVENPKNAVFSPDDFKPTFLEILKKDQIVLDEMCKQWESVKDEDDSKFDVFKDLLQHELFNKKINPSQKLVVFSESLDTVNYLAKRINRRDVLAISADNRDSLFKTIRTNFDANYKEKKDEYNIILTTDVLAEGVNLHGSSIIVNYDTPWNSTKLMQRIGRVNRIGSVHPWIYNYVFYPSREGDHEIKLNRIALSKIQTFHTTFGEDNQIYSGEEIIDYDLDKLFKAAETKEEVNKELTFYEELRDLYVTNRKEYNRIRKLSLRSRTGRAAKEFEGTILSNDTMVFFKTNFRKAFYRVSDHSIPKEMTVVEAFNFFKANKDEKPEPRIEHHHEHVQKALRAFKETINKDIVETDMLNTSIKSNLGAQLIVAQQLLNAFINEIQDVNLRLQIEQLRILAERGVITTIAKRLQRVAKQLKNGSLQHDDALEEVIIMAKKYNSYFVADEDDETKIETEATIILSESFRLNQ